MAILQRPPLPRSARGGAGRRALTRREAGAPRPIAPRLIGIGRIGTGRRREQIGLGRRGHAIALPDMSQIMEETPCPGDISGEPG